MLRQVYLHGPLKDLAGTETLELDVDTPVMLVSALRSQVKGFRQWCDEHKLAIVLLDSDKEPTSVRTEDFNMGLGDAAEIHLLPETSGAGVDLYALTMFLAEYGITSTLAVAAVYVAVNVAISYAIGAIAQALAPSPDTSDGSGRAEERPSFLYNGPVNVVEQGYAVPIVYGTHMTGSIVVSAGVTVEDIPYVPSEPDPAGQPDNPGIEDWQWNTGGY